MDACILPTASHLLHSTYASLDYTTATLSYQSQQYQFFSTSTTVQHGCSLAFSYMTTSNRRLKICTSCPSSSASSTRCAFWCTWCTLASAHHIWRIPWFRLCTGLC